MVCLVFFQLHGQLVQEAVGYGARQGGLDRSEYQVNYPQHHRGAFGFEQVEARSAHGKNERKLFVKSFKIAV